MGDHYAHPSGDGVVTGIRFCDQSEKGQQYHLFRYENNPFKNSLNSCTEDYQKTVFGISTPAADARLLSRRTFRDGAGGVENAVPFYQKSLFHRELDRDISEGLKGTERLGINRGYDMQSIICRQNNIRARADGVKKKKPLDLSWENDPRYL